MEDCNDKVQLHNEGNTNINGKTTETNSETISNNVNTAIIPNETIKEDNYKYIKSPMVGTFYSKPAPNEKSFVEVGETIKKGATVCIIEAMKLMNEIETEFDGEVVEILKNDGDPVEFGEKLVKLK